MAFLLKSATNDRLGILSRRLPLLPRSEIVQGPGATMVMAAFLHADEAGGRFTDGRLGAWYASLDVATAIAETAYHSTRRLRLSAGAFPSNIQMRQLVAGIDCALVDIRGRRRRDRTSTTPTTTAPAGPSVSACDGRPPERERTKSLRQRPPRGRHKCLRLPSLAHHPACRPGGSLRVPLGCVGAISILKLANVASGAPRH